MRNASSGTTWDTENTIAQTRMDKGIGNRTKYLYKRAAGEGEEIYPTFGEFNARRPFHRVFGKFSHYSFHHHHGALSKVDKFFVAAICLPML